MLGHLDTSVIAQKSQKLTPTTPSVDGDVGKMLTSCDVVSGPRGIGAVRSLCLLVIAFGLIILLASSYIDRYETEICERRDRRLGDRRRDPVVGGRRRPSRDDDPIDDEYDTGNYEYDDEKLAYAADTDYDYLENSRKLQSQSSASSSNWDYDWDISAADSSASEKQQIGDRTLVLVRHGQYDFNTGLLTALGREQALMTGQRLRAANLSYAEIIHSTMDRAAETARIIHQCLANKSIPLKPDDMLVEGGPIPPKPTITYWQLPQKTYHLDGPRMEAAFRKYFYRGNKNQRQQTFQILVGHGNIFRFFSLRALQLSKDAWMRVFIAHASITMLHIRADGTVSMTKFGDAGHFPIDKVTY